MIKDYVARAMQISMLDQDQIERLHIVENAAKYILPNWNIQSLFSLPEIKYRYEIPETDEAMISHNMRIEKDIEKLELLKTGTFYEDRVDLVHAQDWNIFNSKDKIVWEYAGSAKKNKLKEMLRGSLVLLTLLATK